MQPASCAGQGAAAAPLLGLPITAPHAFPTGQVGPRREDYIHTVAGGQAFAADRPAFVAIPGYSTGSSFLFKLFDGLSAAMRLYAIDLLGTGLSGADAVPALPSMQATALGAGAASIAGCVISEPPATVRKVLPYHATFATSAPTASRLHRRHQSPAHRCLAAGRPPFRARTREEAEQFFVRSLDAWREAQGLDKMVLMGHSMGGYLSGAPFGQQLIARGSC